jgi:hypothetical protein
LSFIENYNQWRDLRIQDEDTTKSLVVGTTISFSGTGPAGLQWSNVACWYLSAPVGDHLSDKYLQVSVEIVDANEALEVILKQREDEETAAEAELPDFGTVTIGGVVLVLTKPKESYNTGPSLGLTAGGTHYVSGPLVVEKIMDIEGYFDTSEYPDGWLDICDWYEQQIVATPLAGSDFPISAPTTTAEKKVTNGMNSTRYTVSIRLGRVL